MATKGRTKKNKLKEVKVSAQSLYNKDIMKQYQTQLKSYNDSTTSYNLEKQKNKVLTRKNQYGEPHYYEDQVGRGKKYSDWKKLDNKQKKLGIYQGNKLTDYEHMAGYIAAYRPPEGRDDYDGELAVTDASRLKPKRKKPTKPVTKAVSKKLEKLPVKKTENKPIEKTRKYIPTAKNIKGKRKGKLEHIRLRDGKKVLIGESKRRSKRYIKKQNKKKVRQSKGYFERVTSTNPYNMNKVVRKKIKR